MELVVEELESQKRKLRITIPKDVVSRRVQEAYRQINREIKMPGFRSGKIPQNILEKQVPVQSLSQVFQEMMQEYYEKALEKSGFVPAGAPEMDQTDLQDVKKDEPLSFSVTIDIKQEFQVKPYKGLKIKRVEAFVSDGELETAIQDIMNKAGQLEHHEDDHAAQRDDYIMIDFDGTYNGEPLENGSAKDYRVRIGEKKMVEGSLRSETSALEILSCT